MKVIAKIETLDLNRNGNQMTPQALDDLCVDAEGKPEMREAVSCLEAQCTVCWDQPGITVTYGAH